MITLETLENITSRVKELGPGEPSLQTLRAEFSDVHFTYCMDDDVFGPSPAVEVEGFNLYFIDGRDHCLAFTSSADIATGIVVAEVIEDDE